jgi:macrolide transport system ATP-binding/permease protein
VRNGLWLRLRALVARRRLNQDLDDELAFHLEMREAQLGAGPNAARRQFGNVTVIRERLGDMWGFPSLESLWRDVRYGARTLAQAPTFALIVALTIGVGIGANATVFSVVNAVLLRPLPFAHADRLVRIFSIVDGQRLNASPIDLRDFAAESHSFDVITGYDFWNKDVTMRAGDEPREVWMGLVPPEYFAAFGVAPIEGRMFTPRENVYGSHRVAILTNAFRRAHFTANANVIGATIRVNDEPVTIIGVMSDNVFPDWISASSVAPRVEMWMPFATGPNQWLDANRGERGAETIARLKPGVSIAAATEDLRQIAARLGEHYAADHGVGVEIQPLAEQRTGTLRPTLSLLTAAVAMILVLACANVASLLLARNSARQREMMVRASLGASRMSLVRQMLAESFALSGAGAVIGVALAWVANRAIVALHPVSLPQLADVAIDAPVLLFALVITGATSLLCGILPALAGTGVDLSTALRDGGRTGTGGRVLQVQQRTLVAGQIACCVVLLVWSALLVRSLERLEHQPNGFRPDHLLTAHISLLSARYPNPDAITRAADAFRDRVRALPGVRGATITSIYPPNGRWTRPFTLPGQVFASIEEAPAARFGVVDEYYRSTTAIPLLAGRDFLSSDLATTTPVVLINRAMARQYFGPRDPIGQHLSLYAPNLGILTDTLPFPVTIVGVIGDTKNRGLANPSDPEILGLYRQMPDVNYWSKNILVRTTGEPERAATAIARELHAVDPNVALADVNTIDAAFARQTTVRRLSTGVLGLFTVCGVLLAVLGIYGVVSYFVAQRTKEIGVRVSLGAQSRDIFWLVGAQGAKLAGAGIAVGLVVAVLARQALASFVYGITTTDPVTLAAMPVVITVIALAACYFPARRAMRLDPVRALREE